MHLLCLSTQTVLQGNQIVDAVKIFFVEIPKLINEELIYYHYLNINYP